VLLILWLTRRKLAITARTMCIGDGERCASTFAQAAGNFVSNVSNIGSHQKNDLTQRIFEYAMTKVVGSFTMQIGCFVRPPSLENTIGQKPASHCHTSHWCTCMQDPNRHQNRLDLCSLGWHGFEICRQMISPLLMDSSHMNNGVTTTGLNSVSLRLRRFETRRRQGFFSIGTP